MNGNYSQKPNGIDHAHTHVWEFSTLKPYGKQFYICLGCDLIVYSNSVYGRTGETIEDGELKWSKAYAAGQRRRTPAE